MTLNCNGYLLDLNIPKVMGIINLNADSFYKESRITDIDLVVAQSIDFIKKGASIIDLGAMSTRPGAALITHEEEWRILEPVLVELKNLNIVISIDTIWSKTAEKSIDLGAHLINDISGGTMDTNMISTVAKYPVPYVMMHSRGTPETMQDLIIYDNLVLDILAFFKRQISIARSYGMKDIIIDPGFGFAKNLDQNYELIKKMNLLNIFDLPILAGLSRKSMLYKYLDLDAQSSLNATTVANTIALINGAKILRVHDVQEAVEAIKILEKVK